MSDLVIKWICSKCSNKFRTKKEMKEHQLRKREGKTIKTKTIKVYFDQERPKKGHEY